MSEFIAYAPYGNTVVPGYFGGEPDSVARFALVAGDAGLAVEIGQSGGNVNVDTFGGVNMLASSGAFMGIDSFANISLNTSNTASAQITLTSQSTIAMTTTTGSIYLGAGGGAPGADVDIENAGTIAFDPLGYGAITGVQTINGAVYPPPGGGGGTSITQAGALVACLGSGAVTISSIGVGADVEIYNAGTIRFDSFGAGAISGLSTVNGVAWPPASYVLPADITVSTLTAGSYVSTIALEGVSTVNGDAYIPFTGSLSSISNGSGYVEVDSAGTVALQAVGSSFLTLNGTSAVVPNKVTLTAGSGLPEVVLGASGSNDISINNPGSTVPSFLTMAIDGSVEVSGAAVNITNLSTVNGVQFVNGSAPYELPADITVSTLTAGSYVSTLALEGVSSIAGATDINISAGANLNLVGTSQASLLDFGGAGLTIIGGVVKLQASTYGVAVEGDMNVSTLSGVSSINGEVYPPVASMPADPSFSTITIGAGGNITMSDSNGYIYSSLYDGVAGSDTVLSAADDYLLTVNGGNTTGDNSIIKFNTDGTLAMNATNVGGVTDATGLIVGAEGATLTFPLDISSTAGVGQLVNVSTINGSAYPAPVSIIGDIANTYVSADGSSVTLGGNGTTAISIDSANNVILGTVTGGVTQGVYFSTIQASGDGLKLFEQSGGANLNLDTAGKVSFNTGGTTATNGDGLALSAEGIYLTFPLDPTATFGVGQIENVSTINGSEYPPPPGPPVPVASVSTVTDGTAILTIDGTNQFTFNQNILPTGDSVQSIGALGFGVLDLHATNGYFSTLDGISSINGVEYPSALPADITVSTLTAGSYVSTLALEGVSSINGNAFPGAVSWTSTLGSGGFTSTINGADITTPSVVFTPITFPQVGDYTIYQKVSMIKTSGGAGQDLHINVLYDDGGAPDVNNIYQGIGVLPYVNDNVSTFTTVVANARVSTIGDTKSIALLDQSGHSYTVNIIAANPIIQFNAPLA